MKCTTCGREVTADCIKFKCPACGKVIIIRCTECKQNGKKYTCSDCGFIGP